MVGVQKALHIGAALDCFDLRAVHGLRHRVHSKASGDSPGRGGYLHGVGLVGLDRLNGGSQQHFIV
jgi:hypothetical protein